MRLFTANIGRAKNIQDAMTGTHDATGHNDTEKCLNLGRNERSRKERVAN